MKSLHFFAALGLSAAICLTGCVSKKKYATLQSEYDTLAAKYHDSQLALAESRTGSQGLEALLKEARENNEDLKQRYAALQGNLEQSLNQNAQGNVNIAKLVDEINASNRYIKQLVEAKSKSDSLNMVLKGVVYISLADNMLFESGSYEISPRAMEILGKIAKIIKDYSSYDVLVEGNTDNVPISRPNIRNNWDLSSLRASSVVQVLQNRFGVDPLRMTVGGRGEYNPVATNDTPVGRQMNRRTEIIITPNLDQFMDLIGKAPETKDHSAEF